MRRTGVRAYEEEWYDTGDDDLYIPLYVPEEYRRLDATE